MNSRSNRMTLFMSLVRWVKDALLTEWSSLQSQVEEGWYEGILNGQRGLFPSSFTTRIPDSKSTIWVQSTLDRFHLFRRIDSAVNGSDAPNYRSVQPKRTMMKARVLYNYRRAADDELSLAVDDIVTILEKNAEDEGWWKVTFDIWPRPRHTLQHSRVNSTVASESFQVRDFSSICSRALFSSPLDNYVEEIFSTTVRFAWGWSRFEMLICSLLESLSKPRQRSEVSFSRIIQGKIHRRWMDSSSFKSLRLFCSFRSIS